MRRLGLSGLALIASCAPGLGGDDPGRIIPYAVNPGIILEASGRTWDEYEGDILKSGSSCMKVSFYGPVLRVLESGSPRRDHDVRDYPEHACPRGTNAITYFRHDPSSVEITRWEEKKFLKRHPFLEGAVVFFPNYEGRIISVWVPKPR